MSKDEKLYHNEEKVIDVLENVFIFKDTHDKFTKLDLECVHDLLDLYKQEKEKNKNLIKQLQDLSKQLREKEQENIKMRSNFLLSLNDFILKDKIRAFIKKETFEGSYSFDLISAKRLKKLLEED